MSFNKDRRGQRGRGKRDDFGNFDSFEPAPYGGDSYGGGNRGGGKQVGARSLAAFQAQNKRCDTRR